MPRPGEMTVGSVPSPSCTLASLVTTPPRTPSLAGPAWTRTRASRRTARTPRIEALVALTTRTGDGDADSWRCWRTWRLLPASSARWLRGQGLRCLRLEGDPPSAHGVGGKATPLYQALVPCILAGVPGVVRVTVIQEDVPQLLSVGLLEATGAMIDMRKNTVDYQELGVSEPMIRMRSGHRVVDNSQLEGPSLPSAAAPHRGSLQSRLDADRFRRGGIHD